MEPMDQSDSKLAEPKLRDATGPGQLASEVWVGQEALSEASPDTDGRPESGFDVIAAFVKKLPNTPGVYRMLNDKGDVLYVGKAAKLKARVTSYTRPTGLSNRIVRMITQTAAMEFVSTRTETEALLLEANLIKRLRPRFNVLLRDDKSFPYILMAEQHEAAQLVKHRGARNSQGSYFGPFASAGAVGRTINALQKAFLIRTCSDSVYESRTRPCLLYQIKRCSAPCTGEISLEDYNGLVDDAKAFLSGKSKQVKADLAKQMEHASEDLDFERAAVYRDRISALSQIQSHQGINPRNVEEADVFALHAEGGQFCVQVFFFRTGQNWGNHAYFPKADKSVEPEEVLQSFLSQFYDNKPIPKLILTSHKLPEADLMADAFSQHAARRIEISKPQRGEKRDLVNHAITNAREALARKLADSASQTKLLNGLAEALNLDASPRRIEVYDNSHIMGTNAVGGMIVAGPDGFVKNQYRKFNIKDSTLTPGDDFGMMREVLTRRFSRLVKENGDAEPTDSDAFPAWPDLVIIDGGKGQMSASKAVLDDLGITDRVQMIGVSKGPDRDAGRETLHPMEGEPFMLQPRDPVLYFIQRLRDEAHRFAIGTHRAKRSAQMRENPLDEVGGIGPTRKRALLNAFGSVKGIKRAGLSDLEQVPGISQTLARTIYDHFRESG
ncbi:MAG: excinuclease ABC subunit UvrC [Rhizobiales bacterium]|nr:excinuclease ABC subunit UvrC [Hyphomicrobiales bacterium]MBO6697428.1 excinuclease ABC subunit UvrC [Hyphomicrobiales bacterium]MBO6736317.1 excinuclease ABC subunit UvrC [Hyphomicrobiales bacterium]MBO6912787.1 excinuclease ABC subunit UvrC [Hyphomicrobiales bacterium]MBO6953955.1 excinuclease ABC subunit UvrC [Hyphomicrobiales bacterium]